MVCLSQTQEDSLIRHLAMAVGFHDWESVQMALMTAYFDASGSPDDTVQVCAAGLIMTAERWLKFIREWEVQLDDFGVTALHMKDYAHSKREFSSWKDEPSKRRRFMSRLLTVIEENVEHTVAHAVSMREYRATDQSFYLSEFMRPYTLVAVGCVEMVRPWADSINHPARDIEYVFEKGDTDQSDFRRVWPKKFPTYEEPIFRKKRDAESPSSIVKPIRPFEAADLIAYEYLRANATIEDAESRGERPSWAAMRKAFPRLMQLPGARTWRYFSPGDLAATCHTFSVQSRP